MPKICKEISNEELDALTGAIYKRYGIDFSGYEKKSLKRGFARLISKHNLDSLLHLWTLILKDRAFWMLCIDDLTVNLTELFRNPDFWTKLHNEILGEYLQQPFINIWHAGCSTGEEVYSMAVVLDDKNLLYRSKQWATDLSTKALESAEQGAYSKTLQQKYEKGLLEYFPGKSLKDVFEVNDSTITVRSKYKRQVKFEKHNLVQDPVSRKFDIIFCRNVMIYFDDALKMKVLKKLFDALNNNSYLILGYYDVIPDASNDLFTIIDPGTRIYRKKQ